LFLFPSLSAVNSFIDPQDHRKDGLNAKRKGDLEFFPRQLQPFLDKLSPVNHLQINKWGHANKGGKFSKIEMSLSYSFFMTSPYF